jgi:peptide/nickel transport system permease protein
MLSSRAVRWAAVRIGGALITLFGVAVVVFVVLRLIPGDAITASLGIESGTLTSAQRAALEHYYGLDKSVPAQFAHWIGELLHGNLGVSLSSGVPVSHLLGTALPVTIELAVLAALIGSAVGVVLGTVAGTKPGGVRDSVTQGVGLLGLAIPEFVLGTVLVTALATAFGYFPDTGSFVRFTEDPARNLTQLLYPALVLAVGFAANVMRTTRSEFVEASGADHVRTARGKGLAPRRIRGAHVLHNAAIPIVTLTGVQFGYLLGGTVIIEQIFALPGLGRLLFTSITNRDYPVVQSAVLVIAVLFVLVNLAVDLLYAVIDPRTRAA